MATGLQVGPKLGDSCWPVYLVEDLTYLEGQPIPSVPPVLDSVSSWEDLDKLATEHNIPTHGIHGDGLDEMEAEFGEHSIP
jgi:hypothetical protein